MRCTLRTFVTTLVATGIAVSAWGGAVAVDTLVAGKTLIVKDSLKPNKKSVVLVVKDPTFVVAPSDPSVSGATFQLVNPPELSGVWQMPAGANWKIKNGVFTYKDKDHVNGPINVATFKPGVIKVMAKGPLVDYPLFGVLGGQGTIGVRMSIGSRNVCADFPGALGRVKKDDPVKGVFAAVDAEAPAACPGTGGSADGAFPR